MTQHENQRHNYAIARETQIRNLKRDNTPSFDPNGNPSLIFEETGFKNPFNSIEFKTPLEPQHETQTAPVTQPSDQDRSGHVDIRERRKVIIERMVKDKIGIEIFNERLDKPLKE